MDLLRQIDQNTLLTAILITACFSSAFFLVLYAVNKLKSMLFMFFANLVQTVGTILFLSYTNNAVAWKLSVTNIVYLIMTTFVMTAIMIAFHVRVPVKTLLGLNLVNAVYSMLHIWGISSKFAVNGVVAISISSVALYCGITLYTKVKHHEKKPICMGTIMTAVGVLHFLWGVYNLVMTKDTTYISSYSTYMLLYLVLGNGFMIIINYTIIYLNYSVLMQKFKELSSRDNLTGVYSRRTFFLMLAQKLSEVKRGRMSLCIALLDVDDFKRINDTYGHLVGDKVLAAFAGNIKRFVREQDIVGRYGGEEFMLIMEAGSKDEARLALERLRANMNKEALVLDEHITFSCGFSFIKKDIKDYNVQNILDEIDNKMYMAKSLGKDMII